MTLKVNIASAWKELSTCKVNIGGAWKQVETIKVNIGGAWKEVWNNFVVTLTGSSVSPNNYTVNETDPANAEAGLRLLRDGSLQRVVSGSWTDWFTTEWGDPEGTTVGDDYWVQATLVSGDTPTQTNAGFGSWLQLNATHEWSHLQSVVGQDGPTKIKIEIATDSGGSNIVATGYYQFTAIVESGA